MDDMNSDELSHLKQQLELTEANLLKAASIGKKLLEDNGALEKSIEENDRKHNLEIETLRQEIYSLKGQLRTRDSCIQNMTSDAQMMEKSKEMELNELKEKHFLEISNLNTKMSSIQLARDHLQEELRVNKELVEDLQLSLKQSDQAQQSFVHAHEISLNETNDNMENQIVTLTTEKCSLEHELATVKGSLATAEADIKIFKNSMKTLEEELESKECQITSYYNMIEAKKSDMEELRVELESLRQNSFDPNRKGNSIFAEVEDHRQYMEQKHVALRKEFTNMKNHYELKKQQVSKLKLHIASLLSVRGSKDNSEYQAQLENDLVNVKSQLSEMVKRVKTLEEEKRQIREAPENTINRLPEPEKLESMGKVYKLMYQQALDENRKLYDENVDLTFMKVYNYDQILDLQKKNNAAKSETDRLQADVIRLRVELDELKKPEQNGSIGNADTKNKEILPFVKKQQELREEKERKERELEEQRKQKDKENIERTFEERYFQKPISTEEFTEMSLPTNRPKKSVCMKETVIVHGNTSINETQLKDETNRQEKPKKKYKKMEAPVIIVEENDNPAENCKQM